MGLLDAGADVDLPWSRWDAGRRPLALAARSGHLAAYELLASRGATADLDDVDAAVLAVARGESVRLPAAPPPALGNPVGADPATVQALLEASAPTRLSTPTGDQQVDGLLTRYAATP